MTDHATALAVAEEAGRLLLELRQSDLPQQQLRDDGDRRAHELIVQRLTGLCPGDGILSEEAIDDPVRLSAQRVWIVDPLDGTREFGERGRSDWAVHVALFAGGRLVAGAVALPAQGRALSTAEPPPTPQPHGGRVRLVVSRTRPPAFAGDLADRLGGDVAVMGSAGAKAAAVVTGEADVYVHSGGMSEWDTAAPVAVAEAAGLHVSRLDGSPLRFNQPDLWQPDLLLCRPDLAARVLEAVAALGVTR